MSDFLTIVPGTATITECFTGELRWLDGVLQQRVSVQTVQANMSHSSHRFEWRGVPKATTPEDGGA